MPQAIHKQAKMPIKRLGSTSEILDFAKWKMLIAIPPLGKTSSLQQQPEIPHPVQPEIGNSTQVSWNLAAEAMSLPNCLAFG
jgi:hypothetical protein